MARGEGGKAGDDTPGVGGIPLAFRPTIYLLFWSSTLLFLVVSSSDWWKGLAFNALGLFTFGFATWCSWQRGKIEPDNGRAWRFLAVGTLIATLGILVMAFSLVRHGTHIDTHPRVTFSGLAIALAISGAGILQFPLQRKGGRLRSRALLDALIFALAFFLVVWAWGLRDSIANSSLPVLDQFILASYHVCAAALLGLSTHVVVGGATFLKGPLGLLNTFYLVLVVVLPSLIRSLVEGTFHQAHPARLAMILAYPQYGSLKH